MKHESIFVCASLLALTPTVSTAAPGSSSVNQQSSQANDSSGVSRQGQPNASCEDAGVRPGEAEFAPGSAFNPDGIAGTKYAGEQQGINDKNDHSVSQYDIACVNQLR